MKILISDESFSYDVYSLVKAFYQNEDVSVEVLGQDGACPFSISFIFDQQNDGIRRVDANNSNFGGRESLSETDAALVSVEDGEVIDINDVGSGKDLNFDNAGTDEISLVVPYEGEERKDYKNKIKREIYRFLAKRCGRELPWGTLTGIRPTKLPMQMLNEYRDSKIKEHLQSIYLISDEKVDLSIDIAKREMGIIDRLHRENGYSLYIGIPFCPTTCMYCSFTSFPIAKWKSRVDDYISALYKEIDYVSDNFKDMVLDSVYIGGGTPTTLDAERIERLLSYLYSKLDMSNVLEFSVEAGRPDSITEDKLRALKDGGVTRISVNPQTMNDETLRLIGRAHTVDDFYRAYELSKGFFENINIDLILGLPGEDDEMVRHTFDAIGALSPNSLTVHSMAIKRAAHMDEFLKGHPEIKSEITDGMMRGLHEMTRALGLEPYYLYRQKNMTGNYENIGFARRGFEGIYNISIMEEIQSIVALGAGSISKRVYNAAHTLENSSKNQAAAARTYINNIPASHPTTSENALNGKPASGKKGYGVRIERCDNVKDVSLYIEKIDEMIERKRKLYE